MTDKQFDSLSEQEFDLYLEEIIDNPPPADLANEFKPWRKAMNRILWGTALTTLTLNFWNLDVIMPAIGIILLLLGYRALRNENSWFKCGYVLSWIHTIWWLIAFAINTTIFSGESDIIAFLRVGTYVLLIPGFIRLLALRNGIRSVQKKADLPPHGGNGMLVWYLIILILGLINFTGISVWGLLIAYIFILRNLYKLSKELDEAGYAISPAPVKLSDNAAKLIYVVAIALALVIGYGFFNKYPMNWTPVVYDHTNEVQGIRQELLDLGFPEVVLDDLTSEEIMACEGATHIMVLQRDYDVDQNRGIGTQEEIDGGKIALTTIDKATPQLRMTYVGVKFGDEREQWQIIHHFEWLDDRKFCGTEAVQLWPYSQEGWNVSSDFTGRVLYELDGETLTSDYHSIGKETYETNALAAQMLGQYESTDVFATFSLPNQGERRRGYVMYELSEMIDGYIISSWFNYVHQYSQLQFPVQTAKDFEMTSFFNRGYAFKTIQTALQFTTHGEMPELF